MNTRPLVTEADYDLALAAIAEYFDSEPETGSEKAERFNLLAKLIEDYEAEHWSISANVLLPQNAEQGDGVPPTK